MAHRRFFLTILALILTASSLSAADPSGQWFKKSVIVLTDLSEVPGMVIEPGTYVLRADDTTSGQRMTIELLNQDETQVLTSFTAVPDHRQPPEFDTAVTFFEKVTSGPKPIQSWYYRGDANGYEFVYPKPRAKEIAKCVEDHIMGTASKDGAIVAITSNGTEVPVYSALPGVTKTTVTEVSREKTQASTTTATTASNRTRRTRPKQDR